MGAMAYAQIKAALQRPMVDAIQATSDEELDRWLDTWYSEEAQRVVAAAIARLNKS